MGGVRVRGPALPRISEEPRRVRGRLSGPRPRSGHTPGSVIVFLALPSGKRYAFVGDIVWRLEGVTRREEKPWLMRRLLGEEEQTLRATLLRLIGIHERYPEITIVPAHDPRGYADMPRLPSHLPGLPP